MPTYVLLWNWTEQGIKTAKGSAQRLDEATGQLQKMGVTVKDTYWTMGAYDGVSIIEAADDATASRAMLWLGGLGNIRTVTARAYTKSEITKILGGLP
ncbi:MAG: GYD domain-containing protein [bacterium]